MKKRLFSVIGFVIGGVLLIALGMWMGYKIAKSPVKIAKPLVEVNPPVVVPVVIQLKIEVPPVKVTSPVVVTPPTKTVLPPPRPSEAIMWLIIDGRPQTYIDDWGYQWEIGPNGSFNCPRVNYPTQWVPGHEVWMYHLGHPERGWYTTWIPASYR